MCHSFLLTKKEDKSHRESRNLFSNKNSCSSLKDILINFQEYEICSGKSLKREEYHKMLVEIIRETKITGLGAKDVLLYLFGVPFITLFIKQSVIPQAIPNYIFVPAVTSATVFLLAKLHMI